MAGLAAAGILGGTFDPIHLGHLVLAESARETFGLSKVIFIPAGNPPHKPGRVMTPAVDRLRMVEIATADNPWFAVSAMEVEKNEPSYTYHTVSALQRAEKDTEWFLIVGADTLAEIPTWYEYRKLLAAVTILAATRPGSTLAVPAPLADLAGRIRLFHPPALDVSSTMIRERAMGGLSLRYLVPDGVADYIIRRGLYGIRHAGAQAGPQLV